MVSEDVRREMRRLQVRARRRVQGLFAGNSLSAFKGRGIEFAEVREYEPGDDVRTIDWNVSARTGRTHIKRFIEERELTVLLACDVSASSGFASEGRLKRRVAAEVGTTLALAATRHNDRVGAVLFTDRVERFIPPRKGQRHVLRLSSDLLGFEPLGRATNLRAAIEFVGRVQRRRALVFVVSDFLGEVRDVDLRMLAGRHEVIAVRVLDRREREIPPIGLVRVRDPETGRERLADFTASGARAYALARAEADARVAASLSRSGIDRLDVGTETDLAPALMRFFRARDRRRIPA